MSGHSKWANIKHKKAAKDSKRGKIFTRLTKEITISARDGGGDVDGNPRLRLAVLNAKAENMPNDNIKRAIQKGTGEIEGVNYEEINYEAYGPNGGAVIIETVTDNRNRTIAEIRALINKIGGNIAEAGAVAWNFERKGVITINSQGKTEDELLEHVLESGAEDMEYDEDSTRIITAFDTLNICFKYFEGNKFIVTESKLEYLPKATVAVNTINDGRKVMKFIENIEDYDDVQNVFSNYDISDEVMEQLEKE